jgi:hypothetical protein
MKMPNNLVLPYRLSFYERFCFPCLKAMFCMKLEYDEFDEDDKKVDKKTIKKLNSLKEPLPSHFTPDPPPPEQGDVGSESN